MRAAVRSLRAIKQAILIAKTSGGADMKKEDEIKMLQKLVKQRKESVDIYQQQNRQDLAAPELEEIAIIEKYLPVMMSEEEIKKELQTIIAGWGNIKPTGNRKSNGGGNKAFCRKSR